MDQSARGLLVVTDLPVELQFTMDLVLGLPDGPIEVFGVARFVGPTRFGRAVGISLMAMTTEENERWWAYYRAAVDRAQRPARYSSADIMARLGM